MVHGTKCFPVQWRITWVSHLSLFAFTTRGFFFFGFCFGGCVHNAPIDKMTAYIFFLYFLPSTSTNSNVSNNRHCYNCHHWSSLKQGHQWLAKWPWSPPIAAHPICTTTVAHQRNPPKPETRLSSTLVAYRPVTWPEFLVIASVIPQ